jgi:hypothetical protein
MGQYGKHGFHMFGHGQEHKVHEILTILRGQSVLPLCAFLFCGFCVKGSQAVSQARNIENQKITVGKTSSN